MHELLIFKTILGTFMIFFTVQIIPEVDDGHVQKNYHYQKSRGLTKRISDLNMRPLQSISHRDGHCVTIIEKRIPQQLFGLTVNAWDPNSTKHRVTMKRVVQ